MAGKRQHTIPQFILRKFACESRRKEHRAYRYSRTRAPAKENIKNISVEQFFYGRPEESELDARITSLEAEMAPLMERLSGSRESQVPLHEDALPEILAHLSTRTQYVRSFGASVLERLAALMEGLFLDDKVCQILVEKDLERGGTLR